MKEKQITKAPHHCWQLGVLFFLLKIHLKDAFSHPRIYKTGAATTQSTERFDSTS